MSPRERREKQALQRNVRRAVVLRGGPPDMDNKQVAARLKKLGVAPGNADRIMDDDSSPYLRTIVDVASKLGLAVPAMFNPDASDEALSAPASGWPFHRISPEEWDALDEWQKPVIEDAAKMKLKELRIEAAHGLLGNGKPS